MHISKFRLVVAGLLVALGFSIVGAGTAYAVQSHMLNARDSLQQAKDELQQAEPDKGGHRINAINLTQQAIDETNLGIQAGAQ